MSFSSNGQVETRPDDINAHLNLLRDVSTFCSSRQPRSTNEVNEIPDRIEGIIRDVINRVRRSYPVPIQLSTSSSTVGVPATRINLSAGASAVDSNSIVGTFKSGGGCERRPPTGSISS